MCIRDSINVEEITSDYDQQRLYQLIWKRTISSQMSDAMDIARGGQFTSIPQNYPEEACKDFHYFITNYWYNLTDNTFVKIESAQPNRHAVYSPTTKTWSWDADLVLIDIRMRRDELLGISDWTQLSDTNLTADEKA